MASYDLNQVLKNRKATQNSGTMALDDISRVKVLSPGMFSFVGPLFYPYGQKEIFYTFNSQNVNYALAKENTGYNGYDVDSSLSVERGILNAMNSNIKKMTTSGSKEMAVVGSGGGYLIREEAPNIYSLSVQELEKVCSIGSSEVKVGTYSMIGKKFDFEGEEIPGLADAAASNIKGAQGSFEADGAEYSFVKGEKPKTYDVFTQADGIRYEGAQPGGDFEDALNEAVQAGADSFESGGSSYVLSKNGASHDVFSAGESSVAKVYTNYTLDTRETGGKVSDDFRPAALMAAALGDKEFTAGGDSYTISPDSEDGRLIILDSEGNEYAEFGRFAIRRYSGEDTMAYDLKKAIAEKIEQMRAAGVLTDTLQAEIPTQEADGSYSRDENGAFILAETEMKLTQRLEGEYVINCDQINYVIDMFAPPSVKHVLGTDGDGFDVLARVMYGGRVSLMVGFVVVLIETFLGVIMGRRHDGRDPSGYLHPPDRDDGCPRTDGLGGRREACARPDPFAPRAGIHGCD